MNDYLWDRSGTPDPEVVGLEELLRSAALKSDRPSAWRDSPAPWRAIAACVLLAFAAWQLLPRAAGRATGWATADTGRRIYTGERLRAPAAAPLALTSEGFGRVDLQPGSELQVVESAPGRQRMKLQWGSLHALIWAPPGQFIVDTPSARAVDLGCQYDLSVDARGDGLLRVETGWVAFQAGGRESFIPAGAACRTTRAHGPGVPYFENASAQFRSAVEHFQRSGGGGALSAILDNARSEDGLTLWHLLWRVDAAQRGAVFDRFAQLVPLPAAVTREKVVAQNRAALDRCWNALGLSDAAFWRRWESQWR